MSGSTATESAGAAPAALHAYAIASRFLGLREAPGLASDPLVLAMLRLDAAWPQGDHVPWCSAFLNYVAWLAGAPRSHSLRARSWLRVGVPLEIGQAVVGWDVAVLRAPGRGQPGAEVIEAPGHVGLYAGHDAKRIALLGGNQGDAVGIASYPRARVLGIRRIAPA